MTAGVDYWWAAVKADIWTRRPDPGRVGRPDGLALLQCRVPRPDPSEAYEPGPLVPVGRWTMRRGISSGSSRGASRCRRGRRGWYVALADWAVGRTWCRPEETKARPPPRIAPPLPPVSLSSTNSSASPSGRPSRIRHRSRRTLAQRLHLRRIPAYGARRRRWRSNQPGRRTTRRRTWIAQAQAGPTRGLAVVPSALSKPNPRNPPTLPLCRRGDHFHPAPHGRRGGGGGSVTRRRTRCGRVDPGGLRLFEPDARRCRAPDSDPIAHGSSCAARPRAVRLHRAARRAVRRYGPCDRRDRPPGRRRASGSPSTMARTCGSSGPTATRRSRIP